MGGSSGEPRSWQSTKNGTVFVEAIKRPDESPLESLTKENVSLKLEIVRLKEKLKQHGIE